MFSFPASDSEKQLVHSAMTKLQKSLKEATQAAEEVIELLESEVLAVSNEYHRANCDATRLLSIIYRIRVARCKMQDRPERIIDGQ